MECFPTQKVGSPDELNTKLG